MWQFIHGMKIKTSSIKAKPTVWRLKEESDRNVACSLILFNLMEKGAFTEV
jgi:hypothetical protein